LAAAGDPLRQPGVSPRDSHEELVRALREGRFGRQAIEYGLIAAGISVAIIAMVNGIGTNLNADPAEIVEQQR
jgi:pilus assembly protein Flp/PilA